MIHGRITAAATSRPAAPPRPGPAAGPRSPNRVAVIGSGPAGLTAALQIARAGIAVDVYEAAAEVGGLSRSIELWGRRVDLGPHRFFSADARVDGFWRTIVGDDHHVVDRLTRIHFDGKLFAYPLRPLDIMRHLGFGECLRSMLSYGLQCVRHPARRVAEESFEDWVVRRFGRRLYDKFFKTYSEKLWGIPCTRLSRDFAAQRIRRLTLGDVVTHAVAGGRSSRHRTLADCFAYPRGGTGMVYERIAARLEEQGGRVLLRQPVREVVAAAGSVTGLRLDDGRVEDYDHVISTMPLTLLVRGLGSAPPAVRAAAARLSFRNTILVYLRIRASDLFPDQWVYVHDPAVRVGRVTNFNNWGPAGAQRPPDTILCCEYWCSPADSIWTASDPDLQRRAATELRATGLLRDQAVDDGHVIRVPRSYPVYELGYRRHVETIADHLRGIRGLTAIGRYGSFKYNNQDHSILMGLLASDNLLRGRTHDLWGLNADIDRYQEDFAVAESGLVAPGEARHTAEPIEPAALSAA